MNIQEQTPVDDSQIIQTQTVNTNDSEKEKVINIAKYIHRIKISMNIFLFPLVVLALDVLIMAIANATQTFINPYLVLTSLILSVWLCFIIGGVSLFYHIIKNEITRDGNPWLLALIFLFVPLGILASSLISAHKSKQYLAQKGIRVKCLKVNKDDLEIYKKA